MIIPKINILDFLTVIPDFPQKGILFRDISPLLANAQAFSEAIDQMAMLCDSKTQYFVGAEARGFIFATALALRLNKGLVLARKKGKLPTKTISQDYGLEYGQDTLEIEEGLLPKGAKVMLIDDILATGGTLAACEQLISKAGGEVLGSLCLLEITFLAGAKKLHHAQSVIKI